MCNNELKLKISHFGIAVKSVDEAAIRYRQLGFNEIDGNFYIDALQRVQTRFLEKDGVIIELIEAIGAIDESPIKGYLKNSIHSIYHICYWAENLERTIETLKKLKYRTISSVLPGIGFGGRNICFMFNRYVGMIELVEKHLPDETRR